MTLSEAKRIVAAYLTGRRVSREDLAEACRAVESDPRHVEHLDEGLGLDMEAADDCATFLSRLAEFADRSEAGRELEMPQYVDHFLACRSCQDAYWETAPTWVPEGAVTGIRRVLNGRIRVAASRSRSLRPLGGGPPPLFSPILAQAAGRDEAEAAGLTRRAPGAPPRMPERQEWALEDGEAGLTVRLVATAEAPGTLGLRCSIVDENGVAISPSKIEITIQNEPTGEECQSGPLSNYRAGPLVLRSGSWRIILECACGRGPCQWVIPVDVEEGADHGTTED